MASSTIGHEDTLSSDEAALIDDFVGLLKDASARRYPTGTMKRFNQGRQTAFLQADFIVPEGLPDAHRVGIFAAPRTYAASPGRRRRRRRAPSRRARGGCRRG